MSSQRRKFTPEYKDEAVKMVLEASRPIAQVARDLGINEGTLGNWMNAYRKQHPEEEQSLSISERARLRELERELRRGQARERVPKKGGSVLREGSSTVAKYEYIHVEDTENHGHFPVSKMCKWLGVSSSGFYEWRARPASAAARRREELTVRIRAVFDGSRETYGHRRVHAALARQGVSCSLELVRHLMRVAGLVPCQRRPWRVTTLRDASAAAVPDRVQREFTALAPGRRLVGDITYIHTWQGFVYLATVIDCCTKKVVGSSIDTRMRTELVVKAIDMAATTTALAPGAVFHSDRGAQGGFNRSSQHLHDHGGVFGGTSSAIGGSSASTGDAFAGSADPRAACGARVLAADRRGQAQRGRRGRGRRVGAGRDALVSPRWRHAATELDRPDWALPVVSGA